MNDILKQKLDEIALKVPEILFPKSGINLSKFACIAADQYTQDVSYWENIKKYIGDEPSTYNLIYPEAYLEVDKEKKDFDDILREKILDIRKNMDDYVDKGIYEGIGECFIYLERKLQIKKRRGLLVAIDLEKYDYNVGAKSLIRATELTVKDRLIVRKKIRENAFLDLPHILVLINDKEDKLFKEIEKIKNDILYDFELMNSGGNIKGYKITDDRDIERLADILLDLKKSARDGLLYAVGDGNHSLAAAKDTYVKTGKGRYALVELVNIYDEGLSFYPIHRLIIGVEKDKFIKETGIDPYNHPPLQELQKILDKFNYKIDYIHGKEECEVLGKKDKNIAITFDRFEVESLFDDVINHGSLCRKSFSMGEAKDKRYYLEAAKII